MMRDACIAVVLAALLVVGLGSSPASAQESIGAGIFFDLPGCLNNSPCTGAATIYPFARLILGRGITVAHLDMVFLTPTTAAVLLPWLVVQIPLKVAPTVVITPYTGVAPILKTVSATPAKDWLFKIGNSFSFSGFAFFAELSFSVPLAMSPSFALGFTLDFGTILAGGTTSGP
jgi:hypothetical protein